MPDPAAIDRIAAAMNAIRPDWKVSSLRTFLTTHHGARPYRDLAIAAIAIATDSKTTTPMLLNQHGPWWAAAQVASGSSAPIHYERCPQPGHTSYSAANCGACEYDALDDSPGRADTPSPERLEIYTRGAAQVRQILAGATTDVRKRAAGDES